MRREGGQWMVLVLERVGSHSLLSMKFMVTSGHFLLSSLSSVASVQLDYGLQTKSYSYRKIWGDVPPSSPPCREYPVFSSLFWLFWHVIIVFNNLIYDLKIKTYQLDAITSLLCLIWTWSQIHVIFPHLRIWLASFWPNVHSKNTPKFAYLP